MIPIDDRDNSSEPASQRANRFLGWIAVMILILCHLGFTHHWLRDNGFHNRPLAEDCAVFQYFTLQMQDALKNYGMSGLISFALELDHFHPPLFPISAAVINAGFDVPAEPVYLWRVTALYWAALVIGIFRLAGNVGGTWFSIGTVILATSTPGMLGSLRGFYSQMPMFALCIWGLDAIVRSRGFERRGYAILAGVCAAIATLIKPIAPVYLVGSALASLIIGARDRTRRRQVFANAALSICVFLGLLLPWMINGWRDVMEYVSAVSGDSGQQLWSRGVPIYSLERWTYYLLQLVNCGNGFLLSILCISHVVVFIVLRPNRSERRARRDPAKYAAMVSLLVGVGIAYFLLTIGQIAGAAFYISAWPAFCAMIVMQLAPQKKPAFKWLHVVLIALCATWQTSLCYRPLYKDLTTIQLGNIQVVGEIGIRFQQYARASRVVANQVCEQWPNQRIATTVFAECDKQVMAVGFAHRWDWLPMYVNSFSIIRETKKLGRSLNIRLIPLGPDLTHIEIVNSLSNLDFLVVDCAAVAPEAAVQLLQALGYTAKHVWTHKATEEWSFGLISIDSR